MTDRPAAAAPPPARRPADRLHLSPRHRAQLEALLREHLPDVEVWAYGSRITGESHDGSDLDLVLRAPDLQEIPIGRLSDLWEALRESTIPFLVEARDWARLPAEFHGEIERDYVVLVDKTLTSGKLGEYAVISMGQSPPGEAVAKRSVAEVPPGVPLLNGPTEFGPHHPKPVQFTTTIHRLARPGDILFCVRGSTGRMNWADQEYAIGRGLAAIRHRTDNALQPFVRAVLEQGIPDLLAEATGSVFPNVSASQLGSLPYPNLTETEQRTIAHVLGTLDDKIELNRRMNETLEAMAGALFKSWFVDFDPVRAKMDGRDTGLPKEIAELFPDRMVDSKLGRIPEGWPISTLGDHLDATRGLSYKGSALSESGFAMHNLNSIHEGGGYKYGGLKYYDGPYKERHTAHPGDVIVANTEQGHDRRLVGHAAIVPRRHHNGLFSHHLYRVRAKKPFNSEYLCHLLNTAAMHDAVSGYATGTTVNMLPSDALWIPEILVPEPRIVAAFGTVAATISDRMETTQEESENLACLRDSLLPKLVSGELRVGRMDPPMRCA